MVARWRLTLQGTDMAKKIRTVLTLQLPAGKATPAPPVGTALGPHGINIVEFTKTLQREDRRASAARSSRPRSRSSRTAASPSSSRRRPPRTCCARQPASTRARRTTGRETAGKVTRSQIREIAETKMADLNANDIEAAAKIIEGTARSMGIEVVVAGQAFTGRSRRRHPAVRRGRHGLGAEPLRRK